MFTGLVTQLIRQRSKNNNHQVPDCLILSIMITYYHLNLYTGTKSKAITI